MKRWSLIFSVLWTCASGAENLQLDDWLVLRGHSPDLSSCVHERIRELIITERLQNLVYELNSSCFQDNTLSIGFCADLVSSKSLNFPWTRKDWHPVYAKRIIESCLRVAWSNRHSVEYCYSKHKGILTSVTKWNPQGNHEEVCDKQTFQNQLEIQRGGGGTL